MSDLHFVSAASPERARIDSPQEMWQRDNLVLTGAAIEPTTFVSSSAICLLEDRAAPKSRRPGDFLCTDRLRQRLQEWQMAGAQTRQSDRDLQRLAACLAQCQRRGFIYGLRDDNASGPAPQEYRRSWRWPRPEATGTVPAARQRARLWAFQSRRKFGDRPHLHVRHRSPSPERCCSRHAPSLWRKRVVEIHRIRLNIAMMSRLLLMTVRHLGRPGVGQDCPFRMAVAVLCEIGTP